MSDHYGATRVESFGISLFIWAAIGGVCWLAVLATDWILTSEQIPIIWGIIWRLFVLMAVMVAVVGTAKEIYDGSRESV